MYEQFTDRARKVLQLANQEAQRLNHASIGPEHILLGLVKEGTGIAAQAIRNLKVDLQEVRRAVERIAPAWPQGASPGKLPQTQETMQVIGYAIEEAARRQNKDVGTEHLLLALLRNEEGIALQLLMKLGLKRNDVHRRVVHLI